MSNSPRDRRLRRQSDAPMMYALFAGTAGGVGTTTAAALLIDALCHHPEGQPMLADHTGGTLASRIGLEPAQSNRALGLHDLGAHASGAALDRLATPNTIFVLVTSTNPIGIITAANVLSEAQVRFGDAVLRRVLLVPVAVSGRGIRDKSVERQLQNLAAPVPSAIVQIPHDFALRSGGTLDPQHLRRRTKQAQQRFVEAFLRLVTASTGAAATGAASRSGS